MPPGGNKYHVRLNRVMRRGPSTRLGRAIPIIEPNIAMRSAQVSRRAAANAPVRMPTPGAMGYAVKPRIADTGTDSLMMSFTLRSRYLMDSPKSGYGCHDTLPDSSVEKPTIRLMKRTYCFQRG